MAFEELRGRVVREVFDQYMTRRYGEGYQTEHYFASDIVHAMATAVVCALNGVETASETGELKIAIREMRGEAQMLASEIEKFDVRVDRLDTNTKGECL